VVSELALPLLVRGTVVGVLNVESERGLPEGAADAFGPLTAALAPLARTLATGRTLDLPALARLFVHVGSMRDPDEIAAIAAGSLPKILPLEVCQVLLWDDAGAPVELASWRARAIGPAALSVEEIARTREAVEPTVVCQLLEAGPAGRTPLVWLPLRANGEEIGALVGAGGPADRVDPVQLDTAAVLAAHVAASLDAAVALRRERESAVTDPLTGVLNRRGLEERLERELASAKERRAPMSLLVIDCDDLKEINDRAGHEFGDALLREVAGVLTRSLPEGAGAGRLGGDEFVVTLPEAGTDMAEALGERIRTILAEGLTEAGFPLRISAGISTYPFDGAGPTALLRAADQALYAAKDAGKDRIASFSDVVRSDRRPQKTGKPAGERRRGPPSDASILRDATAAVVAFEAEATSEGVCSKLCKSLVFVVGATGCAASAVDGEYLVDVTSHALRDITLGRPAAYRIEDFPLTGEVLRTAEPRAVSFANGDVDPSEAFILRELNMNALLMLPLRVRGAVWGLVELYEMRLRRFSEEDLAVAQFLVGQAERRLELVASGDLPRRRPPVYELPSDGARRGPRTR
jgi:diguanylate cyclase (GGDEF)-like protein